MNATESKAMCWQMDGIVVGPPAGTQSEQCLNLDVYAAVSSESVGQTKRPLRPVFVWLYGGSLVHGSSASYPGLDALAWLGDALLVVPEYRLGAFGFLAHPSLDATDPRGVYGILDQQLALAWVHENVEYFGGDVRRVSLLRQSSGGTSILALLSSPASKGLFSAAISLSASPNLTIGLHEAHAQFAAVVRQRTPCGVGPLPRQAACLRNLSSMQVAQLLPTAFDVWSPRCRSLRTGRATSA